MDNRTDPDGLITTFARQRQALLKHTGELLCRDSAPVRQSDDEHEARLSAVLVSSLEELKVAEEELVERTEALAHLRDELEERVHGAQQLFELAPACLLVTDIYGTIRDANRACRQLFKRDLAALERLPMAKFIEAEGRRNFRDELARLILTDGVNDWQLLLQRPTAGPLRVSATVRVVKPMVANGAQRLFWSIRAVEPDAAALDA
jgi:PAS domain-containing protein